MKNFLQKLRNKPEKVRQRILVGSLLVAIPILFIIAGLLSDLYPKDSTKEGKTLSAFKGIFNTIVSEKPPLNE